MRISDWSSDVCSSDLADGIEQADRQERERQPGLHAHVGGHHVVVVKPLHQGAQADVAGAREAAHGLLLRGVIVEEAAISGYRFLVVELGPQSDPHAGRVLQAARRLGHFPAGELLEVAVIEFQADRKSTRMNSSHYCTTRM